MFLILLLALIALILIVVTVVVVSVGGAIGIIIFGDVIVCILVIVWLIKKLLKK